jgi:hypothetical protein
MPFERFRGVLGRELQSRGQLAEDEVGELFSFCREKLNDEISTPTGFD